MDKYLAMIPKAMLVAFALIGGVVFIVLSDPPVTVCGSQLEKVKSLQTNFLYKDEKYPKSKNIKTTKFQYLHGQCANSNDPGGCYELFSQMRILLQDLSAFTDECSATAASEKAIDRALWETLELMVRLAWGESAPTSFSAKFGWLDTADLSLFCELKKRVQIIYGENRFNRFRDKMMVELPGAKELPRAQVWDMSIFSENCARYP